MKKVFTLFWIVITTLFMNCSGELEIKPISIALSLSGEDTQFTAMVIQGATEGAKEHSVELHWLIARDNHQIQKHHVDSLLALSPHAFIIEVVSAKESASLIQKIHRENIPRISFNTLAENVQTDLYVTPNYLEIGEEQAKHTVNQIAGKFSGVAIISGNPDVQQDRLITKGNTDHLSAHPNIQIISNEWHRNRTEDEAYKRVKNLLDNHLGILEVIVCNTRELTNGAAKAITKFFQDNPELQQFRPLVVGIDHEPDEIVRFSVDCLPYTAGVRLIESAAKFARGGFRHYDGPIFRSGDYIYPVVYTPHRVIHLEDQSESN